MKKPKPFRNWSDRHYFVFVWLFAVPLGIYLIGRLIIWIVLVFY